MSFSLREFGTNTKKSLDEWIFQRSRLLFQIFVIVALLMLIGIPLVFYIWGSFWSTTPGLGGELSLEGYKQLFQPSVYQVTGNTFILATFGTMLSLVLGVGAGVTVGKTDIPYKRAISTIFLAQYLLPGFVIAVGWEFYAQGENGLINELLIGIGILNSPLSVYSLSGMILVTGVHYSGLVYLLTLSSIKAIPAEFEEAAQIAGASTFDIVRKVIVKLALPSIIIAGVLVFTRLMQDMGIPLILGLPKRIYVLATRMFIALTSGYPPDFAFASAMGMVILVVTFIGLIFQIRSTGASEKYEVIGSDSSSESSELSLGKYRYPFLGLVSVLLLFLYVLPVLVVFISSFQSTFTGFEPGSLDFTLRWWRELLVGTWSADFWAAFGNTLLIGLVGPMLGMIVSSFASYVVIKSDSVGSTIINFFTLTPAAMPGIVIATTFLWLFLNYNVLGLYGTVWIIVVAFTAKFIVLSTRSTNAAFRAVSGDMEEAAEINGAGLFATLREVYLPLIKPGFLSGYLLLAILYMKVLIMPLLLNAGRANNMLAVMVWQARGAGRDELSAAVGVVMFVLIGVVYLTVTYVAGADLSRSA